MIAPLAVLTLWVATAAPPPGDPGDLALAFLRDGRVERRGSAEATAGERTPLGSLWKLWVFAYAVESGIETPAYRCAASRRTGEEYCCEPGQSVERDAALARSCGLFFEPERLRIDAAAWRSYWREHGSSEHSESAWLLTLEHLRPATALTVAEILHALHAVPPLARAAASRALLPVVVAGYGHGALPHLGGVLRVKTFTWPHPRRPSSLLGGGGGWLVDGTPVWFAAPGPSRDVLRQHAATLATWLPSPEGASIDEGCVEVDYFARYPIRTVDSMPNPRPAPRGALHGRFRVAFENGSWLIFESHGELRLEDCAGRPCIRGRLTQSDYVARVLDREADAGSEEAARALAVAARTWLLQNAAFENGCFQVADSTRAQRVSPSPPSRAARQVALFTEGLVLKGAPVTYRLTGEEPGTLIWTSAVQQAQAGRRFDEILAAAFPRASLAASTGEEECHPFSEAQAFLAHAIPRWRRALAKQPGFEAPGETLTVCALENGVPYVDTRRSRIYLRGATGRQERLTLAHEYVHLGLRFHPSGNDEDFVERLARSLIEE